MSAPRIRCRRCGAVGEVTVALGAPAELVYEVVARDGAWTTGELVRAEPDGEVTETWYVCDACGAADESFEAVAEVVEADAACGCPPGGACADCASPFGHDCDPAACPCASCAAASLLGAGDTAAVPDGYPRCAACGGTSWEVESEVSGGTESRVVGPPAEPGTRFANEVWPEADLVYGATGTACAACGGTAAVDAGGAPVDPAAWLWPAGRG